MQAIREILTVEKGQVTLTLPPDFWERQVEIIILPAPSQNTPRTQKKSLRGCLREYANPELLAQENTAWEAMADDYGNAG